MLFRMVCLEQIIFKLEEIFPTNGGQWYICIPFVSVHVTSSSSKEGK